MSYSRYCVELPLSTDKTSQFKILVLENSFNFEVQKLGTLGKGVAEKTPSHWPCDTYYRPMEYFLLCPFSLRTYKYAAERRVPKL